MQTLSKNILEKWQVRKTKQQKTAFIEMLEEELKDYKVTVEESGLFKSRNIIVGDLESADYVLTAHYDTAPVLPFPNFLAPKNIIAYIIYCLLLFGLFAMIFALFDIALVLLFNSIKAIKYGSIICSILLVGYMYVGFENKHTANDNTSGVITLIEALHDEQIKDKVCCVFFDHEEVGLFGSSQFAKKHKKIMKHKLLINFDCVSDGDYLMVIYSKQAKHRKQQLEECFVSNEQKKFIITSAATTLYPSDQMSFKNYLGVAAFKRKPIIGYYMDRIHTKKDIIFDEENIKQLITGIRNLVNTK